MRFLSLEMRNAYLLQTKQKQPNTTKKKKKRLGMVCLVKSALEQGTHTSLFKSVMQ